MNYRLNKKSLGLGADISWIDLAYFTVFYALIGNEQGEDYSRR